MADGPGGGAGNHVTLTPPTGHRPRPHGNGGSRSAPTGGNEGNNGNNGSDSAHSQTKG